MGKNDQRLERRAQLLSTRIHERINAVTAALAPPGQRRPFTVEHTRSDALSWWQDNRYSDVGTRVLKGWAVEDIAELDSALSQYNAERRPAPVDPAFGGMSGTF